VIKGVHFVSKHLASGIIRWYVYAWRGGPQIMSADSRKQPKLTSEAIKLLGEHAQPATPPQSSSSTPPATLSGLIAKWQASPVWSSYAPSTQKTWGAYVRSIDKRWGSVPLAVFNNPRMTSKIVDWQEGNADRPRAADLGVDVLKAILKYGLKRGVLQINAAAGIGKIYGGGQREEIIWLLPELEAFRAKAEELKKEAAADALELCTVTGLRRQDLVSLTWSQVKEFAIIKKALKSSRKKRRFASIPRIADLEVALDRLRSRPRNEGVDTVLVVNGRPWDEDELTKAIATVRDAMGGVSHVDPDTGQQRTKHLHDGRGTYATKLMVHTDLSDEEIADIMGWSREEVARIRVVYVDRSAHHMAIGRRIAGKL